MHITEYSNKINNGEFNDVFSRIYCTGDCAPVTERYSKAIDMFARIFDTDRDIEIFSAPGRTEVIGNHTDHQRGTAIGAGVNLDIIGVASKNSDNVIRVKSEGFEMDVVDLKDLSPKSDEINSSQALIRGIASKFTDMGYDVGGFDVYTVSNVLKGSGLSSSAAFEVLIGVIINDFYCKGEVDPSGIAIIGQYAENKYFGKPCGLLDQMSSSIGGFVALDFHDTSAPKFEKIEFDFMKAEHSLCIIDTGGSHADLTPSYAAVPKEMNKVAGYFGKEALIDVDEEDFYSNISKLRTITEDRAILRAIHFFSEVKRVKKAAESLKNNDFDGFKKMLKESGRSSFMYLQNVYPAETPGEQGTSLCLAVCERLLDGQGTFRIHGGGFAGTVQAFVPNDRLEYFKSGIEKIFGAGNCHVLSVRPVGGFKLGNKIK